MRLPSRSTGSEAVPDMEFEPSVVSASRRYWYIVGALAIIGAASLFFTDAVRLPRTRAEATLVLRQPGEVDSDIRRSERFAAEQAKIFQSGAVSERVAEKLGVSTPEAAEAISVVPDTSSDLLIVRYTESSDRSTADDRVVDGVNATIDSYLEVSALIAAEELQVIEAGYDRKLTALIQAIEELYKIEYSPTRDEMATLVQTRRSQTFGALSDAQIATLLRSNPIASRSVSPEAYPVRLSGNKIALLLGMFTGGVLGALLAYGLALREYEQQRGGTTQGAAGAYA